ncbi:MAG: hypothetical protein R2826_05180 [Thermoleophilia bacterium]
MANRSFQCDERRRLYARAQPLGARLVEDNGLRTLALVARHGIERNGGVVNEDDVDDAANAVARERLEMIGDAGSWPPGSVITLQTTPRRHGRSQSPLAPRG